MAYETSYNLKWKFLQNDGDFTFSFEEHKLKLAISESPYSHAFNNNGASFGPVKWYGHEDDMRKLSKLFPSFLFTLDGQGEDDGDLWRKYFVNGKMQIAEATISYNPFNPIELK